MNRLTAATPPTAIPAIAPVPSPPFSEELLVELLLLLLDLPSLSNGKLVTKFKLLTSLTSKISKSFV